MQKAVHNRKKRLQAKRQSVVESATAIIEAIAERRIDAYEGWHQVSGIFQRNAGLGLPELIVSAETTTVWKVRRPGHDIRLAQLCWSYLLLSTIRRFGAQTSVGYRF